MKVSKRGVAHCKGDAKPLKELEQMITVGELEENEVNSAVPPFFIDRKAQNTIRVESQEKGVQLFLFRDTLFVLDFENTIGGDRQIRLLPHANLIEVNYKLTDGVTLK